MAYKSRVSDAVVRRLPMYYRHLRELEKAGVVRISSQELGERMNLTASQIRQDINCFGGFGQQGYGYNIKFLHDKISELLGVKEGYNAVIVGAGNLGKALAATHMFERRGVNRLAMFDVDPTLIGTEIYGVPVYSIKELGSFCKANNVHIGVLTAPKEAAYDVADVLIGAGVKGIWNYANMELKIDSPDVIVENIHLGDSLMTLCYAIKTSNEKRKDNE